MPVVYAGTNQMHAGMTPIMATTAPQVFTRGGKKKKKTKRANKRKKYRFIFFRI